jgi:hypothetical protein
MKKEYIIGGLAIVGGLSLLAYFTSKPRRNSEGFFNAVGKKTINKQEIPSSLIPTFFRRRIFTVSYGITKNYCANFFIAPNILGTNQYLKQPFLVLNGIQVPVNNPEVITYNQFLEAYKKFPSC